MHDCAKLARFCDSQLKGGASATNSTGRDLDAPALTLWLAPRRDQAAGAVSLGWVLLGEGILRQKERVGLSGRDRA
jgi:hypothetical protein